MNMLRNNGSSGGGNLTHRQITEIEYFNREAQKDLRNSVPLGVHLQYLETLPTRIKHAFKLLGNIDGKKVLDFGCGSGWSSVICALLGAEVYGFDISPVRIEVARLRANASGINQAKIHFNISTAEHLEYPDKFFDNILGMAILHHIEIEPSASEIHRVLKTGGRAIFLEPIYFSNMLLLLRNTKPISNLVPNYMSEDTFITQYEEAFTLKSLKTLGRHFSVDYRSYELLSRLDRLIKQRKVIIAINKLDEIVLKAFPVLRRFGRWAVIECKKVA